MAFEQPNFATLMNEEHFVHLLQNAEKLDLVSFTSKLPVPVAILNCDARFIVLNQQFADIYESDALYLYGKLLNNFSTIVYAQFQDVLLAFEAGQEDVDFEFYSKGRFYLSFYKALRNSDHQLIAIIIIAADVTKLKRREKVLLLNNQKLHDHIYLDSITGLPNKMALDRLISDLHHQVENQSACAFLKIDLDDFKRFNQLNSYTRGDEALAQIGVLLNGETSQDTVKIFRINSASFIIFIDNATEWAALTLAERLKFAIQQENILFENEDAELLTASIGICNFSSKSSLIEFDLLQKLDLAVRHAKAMSKNSIHVLNSNQAD